MKRLQTNVVQPVGPEDATMLFVGEAPGEVEDIYRVPFKGDAGQLLNRCFSAVGIIRSEVRLDNVFQQRPPKNKAHYYFLDKTTMRRLTWEGEEHVEKLKERLEKLLKARESGLGGPNVIVALGSTALYILTGKRGITKWRGTVLPCTLVPGFKVYPTFHPSRVNRLMNETREHLIGEKKKEQQNILPLFLRDLERAVEQSEYPEIRHPKRNFIIFGPDTFEEGIAYLRKLQTMKLVSCDIETLPGNSGPILWCIGFSGTPEEGVCYPFLRNQSFVWSVKQEALLLIEISKLFLSKKVHKVFHGGMYDMSILGRYYSLRVARGTYEDTMYGHQMNYPDLRKNLALCTSIYTWEPYYKDEGKSAYSKRSDQQEFIYNCKDCCVTREIFPIIQRDALEQGTYRNYALSMSVLPSLLKMSIQGVKIDLKKKAQLVEKLTQQCKEYKDRLLILSGEEDLNPNSPTQLKKLLYVKLECEPQYKTKTGKLSTDKDAIVKLLKKHKNPNDTRHQILVNLKEYKKFSKLLSTYAQMEVDEDERVRTAYGWISTFRLNSSTSHFGKGGNLQNIPVRTEEGKAVRKLFVPDKGMILVAADLVQAEAQEVAWLAEDIRLMRLFQQGWDVHWARTKSIFGFPEDLEYEPNKKLSDPYTNSEHTMKFYRQLGKTIVHARNYLMGPNTFYDTLARQGVYLSIPICKKLIHADKVANPLIVKWQNDTIEEVRSTRTLVTALGDVRIFRGRLDNNLYRSAIAFRPQSVVGRLLQIGIQRIDDTIGDVFSILLNIHDEVIGQCREKDLDDVIPVIKECLKIPHTIKGRELTIPCDFKIGYSWGDLQELDI